MSITQFLLLPNWVLILLFIYPAYAAADTGGTELNTLNESYTASLLSGAKPDPSLSPQDVVQIQMRALQQNGPDDAGIRTTFRFASPANKQITGPYERFAQMIKAAPYRAMLNSVSLSLGDIHFSDNQAMQEVRIVTSDGQAVAYVFHMRHQDQPPYQDCWMTEAVYSLPTVQDNNYKHGPPGFG